MHIKETYKLGTYKKNPKPHEPTQTNRYADYSELNIQFK